MSDTSIMNRGRPTKRIEKRQRSRTCSEVDQSLTAKPDNWQLPKGLLAAEASVKLEESEKEKLRMQAIDQAERFEVLNKKDVKALSRVCTTELKEKAISLIRPVGAPRTGRKMRISP